MSGAGKGERSLKRRSFFWLCAIATADALVLAFLLATAKGAGQTWADVLGLRGVLGVLIPPAVLVLSWLVSPGAKASILFWKGADALPGHRAFTQYGPADVRVDMESLARKVGALPTNPAEQNKLWYRLYRDVRTEVGVEEAHAAFLVFRDLASMSLLAAIVAPIGLYVLGMREAVWVAFFVFAAQYILATIAGRQAGVRFVTTVLAEHALDAKTPRPKSARQSSAERAS